MSKPPLVLFDHEDVCSVIRRTRDWYEGDILRDVQKRAPLLDTVVDAGAHIGNHSVYWLQNQAPALLLAFEPMPEQFALLRQNLERFPMAFAIPVALSDSTEPLWMEVDEVNRGRCHVSDDGEVRVPGVRLDAWGLDSLSLLKVDVEGWQAHVLRGATDTLARCHPLLLVEDGEGHVPAVLGELGLDGYRLEAEYPGANFLYRWGLA